MLHPNVYLEGPHTNRLRLRDPLRRSHRRLDHRRSRRHQQFLRDPRNQGRDRRRGRAVRATSAGLASRRRRARRQLHRAQEHDVGRGSKANHLAYLGDTTIGEKVNIGAGTITCNYDGVAKHQTIIEDGAFIGSDSQLIAPVRIGRNAYVAAGSSITEDVPPDSLAIARGRQVNKPGWIARSKRKK